MIDLSCDSGILVRSSLDVEQITILLVKSLTKQRSYDMREFNSPMRTN